jgi:hypothetical protein
MSIEEQTPEPHIPQTNSPIQNQSSQSSSQSDHLHRISIVESSVSDIRDEMHKLVSIISPIIQTSLNSNQ